MQRLSAGRLSQQSSARRGRRGRCHRRGHRGTCRVDQQQAAGAGRTAAAARPSRQAVAGGGDGSRGACVAGCGQAPRPGRWPKTRQLPSAQRFPRVSGRKPAAARGGCLLLERPLVDGPSCCAVATARSVLGGWVLPARVCGSGRGVMRVVSSQAKAQWGHDHSPEKPEPLGPLGSGAPPWLGAARVGFRWSAGRGGRLRRLVEAVTSLGGSSAGR